MWWRANGMLVVLVLVLCGRDGCIGLDVVVVWWWAMTAASMAKAKRMQ